jgi:exosortase
VVYSIILKPRASWLPWLLYAAIALFSVARHTLLNPLFGNDDESLLFAVVGAVLWIERSSIISSWLDHGPGYSFLGAGMFGAGLLIYMIGRLYPAMIMEIWGLFLLAAGLVAAFASRKYLRSSFFIAISGTVVVVIGWIAPGLLSSALAVNIAALSAKLLTAILLPVVADGVTLYFGPYTAEVAKACSGMNSIFSLTALAVLYLRTSKQRKIWHMVVLIACVIPVAALTNFIRVIVLVVTTLYVGEWFAQGLFHSIAGIVAFSVALATLSLIDSLIFRSYSGIKSAGNVSTCR